MSVSSIQQTGAIEHVLSPAPADGGDAGMDIVAAPQGDLDRDEPPPGMDPHDSVSGPGQVLTPLPFGRLASPHVPLRHGLAPFPPVKPPPVR